MDHEVHAQSPEAFCRNCQQSFQASISRWGRKNRRSFPWRQPIRNSYELVVAEILLQQTRAESVSKHFSAVVSRCPDWSSLSEIPAMELEDLLKPLGLHRRRAKVLRILAKAVVEKGLPEKSSELATLPGIGQYMARAISTQLSMEVVAPIDGNVARVLERVFGPRKRADIRFDPWLQDLALSLVPPSDPGAYFESLLDFAALVCKPRRPRCAECPVIFCRFRTAIKSKFTTRAATVP